MKFPSMHVKSAALPFIQGNRELLKFFQRFEATVPPLTPEYGSRGCIVYESTCIMLFSDLNIKSNNKDFREGLEILKPVRMTGLVKVPL